ncbi:segregation and condensation protein A [Candidatus Manganitrophus noduliformans]|uniref:Segregation and condensation protein A n=1 Tax=Candidatus Manganitrophus noduliformans TaxID=2606439 RepID=A0A7X6DUK0_9BACT|nr:segregation/condensation protein A [Candidatus Manganitrophus noduliformans]NKE73681.1 segregation/condensation protein A [Candidatus Manganitrophus noduliformans]
MESEAAYEVKVGTFEGPLELLLHLIKKNEINIYDIPIALITQQYIETLDLMKSLNLSIAGEFLVMAATLIHIKSKTLLPPAEEEADEEDPRRELVARLLEYQKFKDAAEQLEERESLWREIFRKEPSPSPELLPEEVPLVDLDLYDLLDALKNVLAKIPDKKVLQVTIDELSVKDRMQFLMERMGTIESILFDDLFEGIRTRHSVVVTFLALLEIIRLGLVRVVQGDDCGPLRLFKTKNLSGEVE